MTILRYRLVSLISAFGLGLIMVCGLLLVFGRLASPATAAPLYAGPTTITQSVTVPTTWAAADSPFIISGTINVQSQLTISPSVVVSFTQGSRLVVQPTGILLANGTSAQPIQFTSNPGTCYWEGVRLESNGNQIQYATFEYASQALKLESSNNHTIQFNTFQNNGGCTPQPSPLSGAIIGFSDNSLVSNNVFTSNHTAIYLTRSGGNLISGNIISGTTVNGIYFPANPATASQDNQFLNNTVRYAGEYGILLAKGINNSVVGNNVYQNGVGGIRLENQTPSFGSSFLVQNNNIYSNTGPALTISQTVSISLSNNLIWDNSGGVLWDINNNGAFSGYGLTNNVVCNNTDYLFRNNDASPPFTTPATPNWWGTNTPTSGAIASGSDIEGDVNIDPRMIFTATSAITSIPADGVSTTVVTISLQSSGLTVPSAARTVNLSTNLGTLSANQVTLDASGVATVTLQSAATPGTATITAVEFCGFPVTTTVEFLATDVGINKTATISQVIPGQTVTYTIAYSNATAVAATNVVITDALPTDLQFVSDDSLSQGFSRIVNGQTIVWSHPSLGGNVSGVISLVASLPQTATTSCGQTLTNSAVITTSTIDSNSGNDSSSDSSVTVICADVGIQKTTALSQVALGDTVTYTIAYSNAGTATADNVIITDTLPAGTGYISDTSGLSAITGSTTITWPVGSLSSGGSGSFELALSTGGASCGDSLSNAASISTTTPESDTVNNGPSTAGSISVLCADAQINKSTVLTQVTLGDTVTYTLAYSNTGGVSAANVVITDTLPAGTGYVSDTSGLGVVTGGGVVTWNVGVLNPGANNSFEVVLSSAGTSCGDSLINAAGIDTTTPDSNLANNSDTAGSVGVACADVTLTKVAPANIVAGTTVTYTIFYTNIGVATAGNVIITDAHPITGGIDTLVSGITLNPNQGGSISYPVYVDPAICGANPSTTITNTAYISTGTAESNNGNNVSTVTSPVQCIPNLVITKTLAAPAMSLGKPVTFTIAYENAGVITAPNTVITDFLSANVSYVTDTFSSAPVTTTGTVQWSLGDVAPGDSGSFEVSLLYSPPLCVGSIFFVNRAAISSTLPDADPSNNSDLESSGVIPCNVDLVVLKNDGVGGPSERPVVLAGDAITYTITYLNAGGETATGVVLTETLPAYTQFVGPTGANGWFQVGASSLYTYNLGALAASTGNKLYFVVQVVPTLPATVTVVNNQIEIDGNEVDAFPGDNISFEQTPVQAAPDLRVEKAAITPVANPGGQVTYAITVTNQGTLTATNVFITDTLPANTGYASNTVVGAPVSVSGSTVVWDVGQIDPAQTISFNLTLDVAGGTAICSSSNLINTVEAFGDVAEGNLGNNTTSTTALNSPVVACRDIAITKTVDDPQTTLNRDVIFTLTYSNPGLITSTSTLITDALPSGISFVQSNPTHTGPFGGVYQWPVGDLLPGITGTVVITGRVDNNPALCGQTLTNTAGITGTITGDDEFLGNNQSSVDVTVLCVPDLVTVKNDGVGGPAEPPFAQAGDVFTYSILYSNIGIGPATGVVLTETLPNHTSFVGPTGLNGWFQVGATNQYTYSLGTVNSGAGFLVNFAVQVENPLTLAGNFITNTVCIGTGDTEVTLNNNCSFEQTFAQSNQPRLNVTKSATPSSGATVQPGQTITYTVVVLNDGQATANNVLITDTLPLTEVGFVTATLSNGGSVNGPNPLTATVPTLAVNESVTMTVVVTVNNVISGTVIGNTAQAVAGTLPVQQSNTVTHVVDTGASLIATKVADPVSGSVVNPGGLITYTITVTNIGPSSAATNVTVIDPTPISTTIINSSTTSGTVIATSPSLMVDVGTLPVNGSAQITFLALVDTNAVSGTVISNTAQVTSVQAIANTNVVTHVVDSSVVLTPSLIFSKSAIPASGSTVNPLQTITYTISVNNVGTGAASGVVITDALPISTTFVSSSTTQGSVGGPDPLVANIGAVLPGQTQSFTFSARVDSNVISGTVINNVGQVSSDQMTAISSTNVTTHTVSTSTVGLPPTLIIQKVADPPSGASISPGSLITYTVWITNQSLIALVDATNVVITDVIPTNTTYAGGSASATQGTITVNPGSLVADIGTVAANQTVTFTFQVTVTTPLTNGTQITNTADVSADLFGPQQTNTVTHTVTSAPLLSISKLSAPVSGATVDPGDPIIYFILVANNGDATATNVTITDTLPISTEFVLQQLVPPTGAVTGPDPLVTTIPSLAGNGGTVVFRFAVTVTNSAPTGLIIPNQAQISSDQTTVTNTNVVTHIVSVVTPPTATLAISKVAQPVAGSTIAAGSSITYTITVTNTGAAAQTNVSIFDILDGNTTLVFSSTTPSVSVVGTNPIFATWPTLAAGDTVTMVLRVDVAGGLLDGTIVTNSATGFSNESPLVATGPVTHVISSLPLTPSLVISKTATPVSGSLVDPGQFITYTITARNTSGVTVNNVVISDTLDANVTLVNSSTTTGTISGPIPIQVSGFNLAAGESVTVTLGVTVTGNVSGTVINNTASVTSPQILSMQTSGLVTHVISSTIPPTSNLVIAKAAIPASGSQVEFGDTITYTIVVLNTGAGAETNVVISDTLDANVTLVTSNTTGGAISGPNPLQVSIPTLNGGQSVTVTLAVTVASNVVSGTIINNRAGVSSDQTTLPQVTGVVTHIISSTISASPGLTLTKSANPPSGTPVSQGDSITYTIVVSNGSGSAATNVVLTDTIPSNTAFVPGSQSTTLGGIGFDGSRITVTVSSLPSGVAFTTTFRVTVTTNITTTITNIASVNSDQTTVANSNVVTHPVLGTGSLNVYLPIIYKDFSGPSAVMSWLHQVEDRVSEVDGSNALAFTADGRNDGAFLVTVNSGTGAKTISNVVLTSSQGGSAAWDTLINGVPVLGIFDNTTRLNNANGTISQMVNGSVTVAIYASDDAGGTRFPEDTYDYTVTINFTDGTSATATARIPVTPPPPPPVCDVVADIAVGNTPRGVAIDSTRNRAYVANFGSSSVSVIDTNSNTVLQTLSPITGANGIAYDATQNIIWVTNQSSNQVTPIQADAGATNFTILSPISVGSSPWGVTHDPVHNYVYVVNNGGNSVTVIDASARTVLTTLSGSFNQPYHVAANTVTGKVYAPNFGNHTVTVIDGASVSSVVDLTAGDPSTQPYGVAVDETRELVYVSTVDSHRVVVIGRLGGVPDQLLGWAAFHRGFNNPSRPVPLRAIAINPDIGPISPMDDGGHVWLTTSTADGSEANQALLSRKGWSGYFHSPVPCDVGTNPSEGIAIDRALDRAFVTSGTNPGSLTIIVDNPDPPLVPFLTEDGISVEVFRVE